jgi:hypothetical protein
MRVDPVKSRYGALKRNRDHAFEFGFVNSDEEEMEQK